MPSTRHATVSSEREYCNASGSDANDINPSEKGAALLA